MSIKYLTSNPWLALYLQVVDININKLISRSVPQTNNLGGDPYSGARQRENHQGKARLMVWCPFY